MPVKQLSAQECRSDLGSHHGPLGWRCHGYAQVTGHNSQVHQLPTHPHSTLAGRDFCWFLPSQSAWFQGPCRKLCNPPGIHEMLTGALGLTTWADEAGSKQCNWAELDFECPSEKACHIRDASEFQERRSCSKGVAFPTCQPRSLKAESTQQALYLSSRLPPTQSVHSLACL